MPRHIQYREMPKEIHGRLVQEGVVPPGLVAVPLLAPTPHGDILEKNDDGSVRKWLEMMPMQDGRLPLRLDGFRPDNNDPWESKVNGVLAEVVRADGIEWYVPRAIHCQPQTEPFERFGEMAEQLRKHGIMLQTFEGMCWHESSHRILCVAQREHPIRSSSCKRAFGTTWFATRTWSRWMSSDGIGECPKASSRLTSRRRKEIL